MELSTNGHLRMFQVALLLLLINSFSWVNLITPTSGVVMGALAIVVLMSAFVSGWN